MNLKTLKSDVAIDTTRLMNDLGRDLKAECVHIADPAQCGSIVRRRFNLLLLSVLTFAGLFIATMTIGVLLYTRF